MFQSVGLVSTLCHSLDFPEDLLPVNLLFEQQEKRPYWERAYDGLPTAQITFNEAGLFIGEAAPGEEHSVVTRFPCSVEVLHTLQLRV